MPLPRTGSVESFRRANGRTYYRARIRLGDGSRVRVDVPEKYATPAGRKSAAERAELYAQAVQEREDETGDLLKAKMRREAEQAKQRDPRLGETVALWSERWVKVRRARGLRSVDTDGHRLNAHVLPHARYAGGSKRGDRSEHPQHSVSTALPEIRPPAARRVPDRAYRDHVGRLVVREVLVVARPR
jgi:hypothetical protein